MLDKNGLDLLWNDARSQNGWTDKPVSDEQITHLYDLLKMGPTSANGCPARFVFIKGDEAKERLKPTLFGDNVEKAMSAPFVAIIAYDTQFHEKLPELFPHDDAKSWYAGKPEKIKETAIMNTSLQGAYLIMAARSIGLDCGPIGGYDNTKLDLEFFPDGDCKSIFICGLGYGDSSKVFDRLPRLDFNTACEIL
jgi:3-hydroxypropanoate dehydrogenase